MIAMSIVGFTKGNYKALIAGVDSHGNICGYSDDVKDMPMTYYRLEQNGDTVDLRAVCTSVCPDSKDFKFGDN
jgi:hypothetical protein